MASLPTNLFSPPLLLCCAIPNEQALRASVAKYKALFEDATAKLAAFEDTEVVVVSPSGGGGSGSGDGGGSEEAR